MGSNVLDVYYIYIPLITSWNDESRLANHSLLILGVLWCVVTSQTLFKLDLSYFIAMPIITLGFLWKFPELWMWDKFTLNFSFHGKVLKQFCHHFWHWAREWKSKRLTNIAVETQGPASQYSQIQSNSNFMWTFLTDRKGWIHNEIQKCLFFLSRIFFLSPEFDAWKKWRKWKHEKSDGQG